MGYKLNPFTGSLDNVGGSTSSSGGASAWGDLTGTLSDQTDLQAALDAKADKPPTLERRADLTHGAITYIGLAPDGTSDAAATWTIYKFDTSDVENITRLTATVATWNNRLTETYS